MDGFFVKKPNGDVYGPIDDTVLGVWSADGRVAPEDLISRDNKAWQPAAEVEEAQLFWTIDIDGEEQIGPIHILAARDLIADGLVRLDDPVSRRGSPGALTVREALIDAALADREKLLTRVREQNDVLPLRHELDESRLREQELRDKLRELRRRLRAAEAGGQEDDGPPRMDLDAGRDRSEAVPAADTTAREEELKLERERLAESRRSFAEAQAEVQELKEQRDQLQRKWHELRDSRRQIEEQIRTQSSRENHLRSELKELQARLEGQGRELEQVRATCRRLEKERDEALSGRQAAQDMVRELQHSLRRERDEHTGRKASVSLDSGEPAEAVPRSSADGDEAAALIRRLERDNRRLQARLSRFSPAAEKTVKELQERIGELEEECRRLSRRRRHFARSDAPAAPAQNSSATPVRKQAGSSKMAAGAIRRASGIAAREHFPRRGASVRKDR